jgi:hypothetical protein
MSSRQEVDYHSSVRYINSPGFVDKLMDSLSVHKYCLGISSTSRITKNVITKLFASSISE